jgi:hypothetical protein
MIIKRNGRKSDSFPVSSPVGRRFVGARQEAQA